ncbi:MAG: hypothetical protein PW843_10005 [Azospirillaceae bacterium]|nr:hypothetical protein [Azospirillaceae bacterium]
MAAAYSRVAAVKAMKKTVAAPGANTIEATLGVVFAIDAAVPLEDLAAELERLNARTPSDYWVDAVVIAAKGQIAYMAQWVGDKSLGLLLPPSPGANLKTAFPCYAVMMISASGAGTFNLAMHMLLGQMARWSHGYALPGNETILESVQRQGLVTTGYWYDRMGELRPVPRNQYNDRAMPPKSVALYPRGGKEPLAAMCFVPWQYGGVVLLQGKLPLEGMLVFLSGIIDAEAFKTIRKVTRDKLQISSVLPIRESQYQAMLRNIQQRGGLDVKPNEGKFVVQKLADEGTGTPFMARVFYGLMKMADTLDAEREPFLAAHHTLLKTLLEIRDMAKDIAKTWKDHARKVDEGSIVERVGIHIRITENVDRQLGRLTNEFLSGATRSFKERMQATARSLGLDIGFLYQKQSPFERGLAALELTDPALAAYLREARRWGDILVNTRNLLDHGNWALHSTTITDVGGKIFATEPTIDGIPVTEWVADKTDRVLCFVEDVVAHGIQRRMRPAITLAEVPLAQRSAEMPLRFQNTLTSGGAPTWQITYHGSRFDET